MPRNTEYVRYVQRDSRKAPPALSLSLLPCLTPHKSSCMHTNKRHLLVYISLNNEQTLDFTSPWHLVTSEGGRPEFLKRQFTWNHTFTRQLRLCVRRRKILLCSSAQTLHCCLCVSPSHKLPGLKMFLYSETCLYKQLRRRLAWLQSSSAPR